MKAPGCIATTSELVNTWREPRMRFKPYVLALTPDNKHPGSRNSPDKNGNFYTSSPILFNDVLLIVASVLFEGRTWYFVMSSRTQEIGWLTQHELEVVQ